MFQIAGFGKIRFATIWKPNPDCFHLIDMIKENMLWNYYNMNVLHLQFQKTGMQNRNMKNRRRTISQETGGKWQVKTGGKWDMRRAAEIQSLLCSDNRWLRCSKASSSFASLYLYFCCLSSLWYEKLLYFQRVGYFLIFAAFFRPFAGSSFL